MSLSRRDSFMKENSGRTGRKREYRNAFDITPVYISGLVCLWISLSSYRSIFQPFKAIVERSFLGRIECQCHPRTRRAATCLRRWWNFRITVQERALFTPESVKIYPHDEIEGKNSRHGFCLSLGRKFILSVCLFVCTWKCETVLTRFLPTNSRDDHVVLFARQIFKLLFTTDSSSFLVNYLLS